MYNTYILLFTCDVNPVKVIFIRDRALGSYLRLNIYTGLVLGSLTILGLFSEATKVTTKHQHLPKENNLNKKANLFGPRQNIIIVVIHHYLFLFHPSFSSQVWLSKVFSLSFSAALFLVPSFLTGSNCSSCRECPASLTLSPGCTSCRFAVSQTPKSQDVRCS